MLKWALNVLGFTILCLVIYIGCIWLFEHGYFTAPGSPKREID